MMEIEDLQKAQATSLSQAKNPRQENKCKHNPKNDCSSCDFEGCPNWSASLKEGDLE